MRFHLVYYLFIFMGLTIKYVEAQSFVSVYSEAANTAFTYFNKYNGVIVNVAKQHKIEPCLLFSIVAPEVSRYHALRDAAETAMVEMFYVQLGTDYADFSIGAFQMKMQFIESLESEIKSKNCLKRFRYLCNYSVVGENEIRQQRVNRMKSVEWQVHYLCAFYYYTLNYYQLGKKADNADNLRFIATVYNRGLKKPASEIERWMQIKSFPAIGDGENFTYGEVAVEFYKLLDRAF